jgi:putative ABC transport system permease protein
VSLYRQVVRGVRALSNRAAVDAEVDDEVRDYFERACADLVQQGLTPEEAARVARRELGDLAKARDTLRAYGWENQVDATLGDFRQAWRRLRQNPSFSAIVVATLAVGIGVNVALFSLFQQILLRPLPVAQPERLVNLVDPGLDLGYMSGVAGGLTFGSIAGNGDHVFSYPLFRDLERQPGPFAGIAAHRLFDASLSIGENARREKGFFVSGSYFSVLGLRPALGRLLGAEDDRVDGQAESVVLSHAYWQRELAGDPGVLGRKLTVNGAPLTIVGVAPEGFHGTTVGARASVFVPITFRGVGTPTSVPNHDNRGFYWVYLFARLGAGTDAQTAENAINPLYQAILNEIDAPLITSGEAESVESFRRKPLVLEPGARGQSALLAPIGAALEMLFAVSGAVLLLCCANVAGLVLIRATSRTGEMAVRASMGASRGRLASLLLAESLLLAVPAALLSLPVALLVLRGFAAGIPGLPSAAFDVELSAAAAVVAIGAAVLAAVAFGLFPVRELTRTQPATTLHAYGARQTSGKRVTRFRGALATAQVALSMALLALTGVLAQSLGNIAGVELGIDVDSIAMFTISPEASGYAPAASAALFDRLEDDLAAIPGVTAAASAQVALLAGGGLETGTAVVGTEKRARIHLNSVSSDFFRTLDVDMLAGRELNDADRVGAAPAAIINRRLAASLELGANVIGRRIRVMGTIHDVVGLVPDVQYGNVQDEVEPQVFLPRRQDETLGTATFYVRGARPPRDLLDTVRDTVARAAPTVPITDLRTMEQQVRENLATERFVAGAAMSFAVLATALAGLGLYGVLAYSVAQRSREIALRFALGAPAARIRAMVLRQVGAMAVLGVALGTGAALLLGRAARRLLYGVEAADPIALLGAALVLACVMLGAAYIPARRASRVNPIVALRYE